MNAPKKVTWIIALILTIISLAAMFFGTALGLDQVPVVKVIIPYIQKYGCAVSSVLLLLATLLKGL